jgi:hypothetical protein
MQKRNQPGTLISSLPVSAEPFTAGFQEMCAEMRTLKSRHSNACFGNNSSKKYQN